MISYHFPLYWLPLIPLLGALFQFLLGKRVGRAMVAVVACTTIGITALLATQAVLQLASLPSESVKLSFTFFSGGSWLPLPIQGMQSLQAGLALDRLSAVLVLVITWIGLLIHIYATSYMQDDPHYARFFAYLNLFMGSMLILVLGDSMPLTFVGWEGVGLCSYLLIGFWYDEEKNAAAGRKAFIANRIGDFGFLLAMGLLFSLTGSLHYDSLAASMAKLNQPLWFGWPAAYFVAIFLFIGCAGKSAQLPLHIWLPDAMAGPTPVSALIHAATMVTAGVYLVSRTHVLFDQALPPTAKMLVAGIGALTALFAATIGLVQRDFKKVLAYSTVSQLGFMFVGVGTGAYAAGFFHLVTHAFFKAGLFLGAGSVMHALHGEGDIAKMGGLRKHLPITHFVFLVYFLAIAGIFPFSGFFSKDGILLAAWSSHFGVHPGAAPWIQTLAHTVFPKILWGTLVLSALCTAFYMGRLYFLVFHGSFRGTPEQKAHLHESPAAMTMPLVLLAIGSIGAGLLGIPALFAHEGSWAEWLTHWLGSWSATHATVSHRVEILLMVLASLVSILGIHLSYMLYRNGFSRTVQTIASTLRPLHRLLAGKYFIDEAYDVAIVRPVGLLSRTLAWLDRIVVDRILVQGWASLVHGLSRALRHAHNGKVQRGVAFGVLGIIVLVFAVTSHLPTRLALRRAAKFTLAQNDRLSILSFQHPSTEPLFYRVSWEGESLVDKPFQRLRPVLAHRYTQPGTYSVVVEVCNQPPPRGDLPPGVLCQRSDQLWSAGNAIVRIEVPTTTEEQP